MPTKMALVTNSVSMLFLCNENETSNNLVRPVKRATYVLKEIPNENKLTNLRNIEYIIVKI